MSNPTSVPVCSNPFNRTKHIRVKGLRKASKKILRNYPSLSPDQLLCNSCRKDLSSNKVQYDVYLAQPSTSTVALDEISTVSTVDRKVNWSIQQVENEDDAVNFVITPTPESPIKQKMKTGPKTPARDPISYRRLVVPSGMRSIYWKYFGFPGTEKGEIISRDRAVCCLCCKEISYTGNTTNLRAHLRNKHAATLEELELEELTLSNKKTPVASSSGLFGQTIKRKLEISSVMHDLVIENNEAVETSASSSKAKVEEFRTKKLKLDPLQGILNFVYKEMQNPSIVDSEGFREMIMQVNPSADIPTSSQVQQLIPERVHEIRTKILSEIESLTWYSVCVEEWQGVDSQLFFTFVINWAEEDQFHSRTLSTLKWNELTQETVHVMLSTWGLSQEKTVAIVAASAQPALIDILSEWSQVIPCFLFAIQQAISSIFNTSELQMLLLKCRSLICKHITTEDALGSINLDYPKIWTTTYDLLEEFLNRQDDIEALTLTDDMRLNSHDWELIQSINDTCSPFKVTIQTVQEDEPALVSIIKPLYTQLVANYLQIKSEDSESVRKFKNLLESGLSAAYNRQDDNHLLETASYLDLRFRTISFMNDIVRSSVSQKVRSQMGEDMPTTSTSVEANSPPKRMSGMAMLLGGTPKPTVKPRNTEAARTRHSLEMEQFNAEEAVSFETNALRWWHENDARYAQLLKVAQRYLCVPACVVPAKHIPHTYREKFERQRASISLDMVDMMVFLNGNHK
ncbi:E3 SUMO-protein ligase ZBED1 [Neocloeon triangulifer]|uniref:E3 SUMO-protein ligase ZBED1 n=1 Tax=Neocloeon triangulifer TaxID=2078957 RepID=UPI00286EE185|nr:E3 SUMO-protein ligase ZBED1 [Neocloeon triangulifer]